jgi:purine nucleoside phosphorylase
LRVLGLSIVTNVARPDVFEKVDAEEVLHDAAQAGAKVQAIIRGVLAK